MSEIAALENLLDRVCFATGPDRDLDADIWQTLEFPYNGPDETWRSAAALFTSSVSDAVALIERHLPGWWWSCGTCCVSDDANMAPDFNSPIHGERLKAEFFPLTAGSEFDAGFDTDRRPPGNVPLALLASFFSALIAIRKLDSRAANVA